MTPEQPILVTGAAGFIGMHVSRALLARGHTVIGIDNLNDYYPVSLKQARLSHIADHPRADAFTFVRQAIEDQPGLTAALADRPIGAIVHLAAQAGVRHSIDNPMAYARSNLVGMTVILELARARQVRHLVYASSSSVYGGNTKVPYSEADPVDAPVSFYAATKLANESMARSYSHLYRLPATGLRFFTVYGPWGRPDMAPWLFTRAILAGEPIRVFGHGKPQRDFTYIDDIVEGICRVLDKPPSPGPEAPHRLLNIGNHRPVSVDAFIQCIERATGKTAVRLPMPMQPGDVDITFADVSRLHALVGFDPATPLDKGMARFVEWFKGYDGDGGDDSTPAL